MTQRQILRPGRRADRIGLHETKPADRASQRGGLEQRPRNGITPQMIQRDTHVPMIFQTHRRASCCCGRQREGFEPAGVSGYIIADVGNH
jgi:hypothetical protein